MNSISNEILQGFSSSVRNINGYVAHYKKDAPTTVYKTYRPNGELQSYEIQRVADNSRFFGMIICHRINVKLRNANRDIDIEAGDLLKVYIGSNNKVVSNLYPQFRVSEVHTNETTNQLSITAYDLLYQLKKHTFNELNLTPPYTISNIDNKIVDLMNFHQILYKNVSDRTSFNMSYENGANFSGEETVWETLQYITEATQTIVYLNYNNNMVFRRLNKDGPADFTITKALYTSLTSKTNRRLTCISNATDLGDNTSASLEQSGTTQTVMNNPFWDLIDNKQEVVDKALEIMGGLTINQFSCSWIGNPALEVGDKIALITKDNQTVYSFLLDDTLTFNGSLNEKSQWDYMMSSDDDPEPSLGDAIKSTYAKVDRQNREITLLASNVDENKNEIANLKMNTNSIEASVRNVQAENYATVEMLNNEINKVRNTVEAKMTDEQIQMAISQAVENGVSSVRTETGFVFDKDGLTVSKSDSDITTTIDEDGMDIKINNQKVLTVNNEGVEAYNLTSNTFLIVGQHSRFEDYDTNRTGCFWIYR